MHRRLVYAVLLLTGAMAVILTHSHAGGQASNEEQAVRQAVTAFSEAFNKGDVDAVLAFWAKDADYIDDTGKSFKGKQAIATRLKQSLPTLKGHHLKIDITSLRFLKPDVALEDGTVTMTTPDGESESSRYSAVWVKTEGRWLMSSVRDLPVADDPADSAPSRLRELAWLVGDWSNEQQGVTVALSGRWVLNKSYLQLEYNVKSKDGSPLLVSQWIGWDPAGRRIRSWVFDSNGGYAEAQWTRGGNTWSCLTTGLLPDGRRGSSMNRVKFVDDTHFIWQSAEREIEGQPVPDAEVKFVRKPAAP